MMVDFHTILLVGTVLFVLNSLVMGVLFIGASYAELRINIKRHRALASLLVALFWLLLQLAMDARWFWPLAYLLAAAVSWNVLRMVSSLSSRKHRPQGWRRLDYYLLPLALLLGLVAWLRPQQALWLMACLPTLQTAAMWQYARADLGPHVTLPRQTLAFLGATAIVGLLLGGLGFWSWPAGLALPMQVAEWSQQQALLQGVGALDWRHGLPAMLLLSQLVFWLALDVSLGLLQLAASHRRWEQVVRFDELTQVFNRASFYDSAHEMLGRIQQHAARAAESNAGHGGQAGQGGYFVAFLDLDHFKRVNNVYGHQVGDQVLQHFVMLLRRSLRSDTLVGRLGGEEFAILGEAPQHMDVEKICQRIVTTVAEHPTVTASGMRVPHTVSIGAVFARDAGVSLAELLRQADTHMFEAKRQRNTAIVKRFDPGAVMTLSLATRATEPLTTASTLPALSKRMNALKATSQAAA